MVLNCFFNHQGNEVLLKAFSSESTLKIPNLKLFIFALIPLFYYSYLLGICFCNCGFMPEKLSLTDLRNHYVKKQLVQLNNFK